MHVYDTLHTHTGTFFSPLLALLSVVTQQRSLKQLPPASAAATLLNFPINMCLYTAGLQPGPSSAVSLSDHKGGTTRRWLWARHHGPLQTSGCTFYTYSCTFFSTRLLTEIWAAQDCKSRIILRWIKKTFHYHNPVD